MTKNHPLSIQSVNVRWGFFVRQLITIKVGGQRITDKTSRRGDGWKHGDQGAKCQVEPPPPIPRRPGTPPKISWGPPISPSTPPHANPTKFNLSMRLLHQAYHPTSPGHNNRHRMTTVKQFKLIVLYCIGFYDSWCNNLYILFYNNKLDHLDKH